MSKLKQIKAAQIAAAREAGEPDPYQTGVRPPAASNKPANRLAQIKAEQLKAAAETGVNPYERTPPTDSHAMGDLAHYQAALDIDRGKVAAQKTLEDKQRVKQSVLPNYLPFVEDYIKNGHHYPNDVAVQTMIWLLDVGEIDYGLNLALHLVAQQQAMPAKFDRNMETFLCDFFYDWANVQLKAEQTASPYLDTLIATAEKEQWTVHPLCLSKLYAMLAKHKERERDYETALALCHKAEAVNPDKAGVKGLKERLQAHLNAQS